MTSYEFDCQHIHHFCMNVGSSIINANSLCLMSLQFNKDTLIFSVWTSFHVMRILVSKVVFICSEVLCNKNAFRDDSGE